ncbi:MAG: hypothetical protein FWE47_03940 [Oscillospiraceae bacterium]|nr:hypothetical protein [Oscillospiraceae bacterium]
MNYIRNQIQRKPDPIVGEVKAALRALRKIHNNLANCISKKLTADFAKLKNSFAYDSFAGVRFDDGSTIRYKRHKPIRLIIKNVVNAEIHHIYFQLKLEDLSKKGLLLNSYYEISAFLDDKKRNTILFIDSDKNVIEIKYKNNSLISVDCGPLSHEQVAKKIEKYIADLKVDLCKCLDGSLSKIELKPGALERMGLAEGKEVQKVF